MYTSIKTFSVQIRPATAPCPIARDTTIVAQHASHLDARPALDDASAGALVAESASSGPLQYAVHDSAVTEGGRKFRQKDSCEGHGTGQRRHECWTTRRRRLRVSRITEEAVTRGNKEDVRC